MVHCDQRHRSSTLSHLNRERETGRERREREIIMCEIRLKCRLLVQFFQLWKRVFLVLVTVTYTL